MEGMTEVLNETVSGAFISQKAWLHQSVWPQGPQSVSFNHYKYLIIMN